MNLPTNIEQKSKAELIKEISELNSRINLIESDIQQYKLTELELIKTKEKSLESEEKYRALYNNAPLSFQSLDENGCFLDVNPMWLKTLGYERNQVLGNWFGNYLHPDYVQHFKINFPAFKKRGYVSDVQFKMKKKDGTFIMVSFEGCVGYTPEGKFKQTYCVFMDITEHKQYETLLLEANQKLEAFFNQSLNGFFFMMLDQPIEWNDKADKEKLLDYTFSHQRITKVNDAHLKQFGATRKKFIGFTPADMFKHDIETGKAVWRKLFDNGKLNTEADGYNPNGEHIYIEGDYTCLYDSEGRITGHFGVQRDITKSKKAIETILKLSKGIEQSPSSIIITDVRGNIEYVNPKFYEITGYTQEEVIGKNPRILKSGEIPEEVYKELWDNISTGGTWHGEFHNRKKNGELYWEWASITSIKNENGVITNYIAIKEDISIRKALEVELIAAKVKAEENEKDAKSKLYQNELLMGQMIGREVKMGELKKEINILTDKLGHERRYM